MLAEDPGHPEREPILYGKEVGQNIKDKKRDKRVGDRVMKEFPNTRKPSHQLVCGELWNLRGQHNQEGKKQKQKNPQNAHLTATPSGEVVQTLAFTTIDWRLNRKAWVACLG